MALPDALIGGLAGALGAMFLQIFLARTKVDVDGISEHVAQIGLIENLAAEYWLATGKETPEEEQIEAARLRGAFAATDCFRQAAMRHFKARFGEYEELDFKLFDAATGGDFERPSRKADPERVVEVMSICHQLRSLLREQRKAIYWAH